MRRGFTLIELSVVVSILALVVPLIFVLQRDLEAQHQGTLQAVEAARGMRSLSEELRRDLRTMRWKESAGLALVARTGSGGCQGVAYSVNEESVLIREAAGGCGGNRAVARGVKRIAREGRLVEVTFGRPVRAGVERTATFRLGVEAP